MKKKIFFSNWKIYMKSKQEVLNYINVLKNEQDLFDKKSMEVYVILDLISFYLVNEELKDTPTKTGVQDIFWEDYGSYAGEVDPAMLKDLGCDCAYMGHSERKIYFGENDENINKKVLACYRNGIIPFLFVGETLEEFKENKTKEVLERQLKISLRGIPKDFIKNVVIIYEPRWAIGKKNAASEDLIEKCHYQVRELLGRLYSHKLAETIRILYGGSVNLENITKIIKIPGVDGAGSTRSSLNAINFVEMIKLVEKEAKEFVKININKVERC